MESGASVFFNTKIVNNRSCFESMGDFFLNPVRTLFGGKTVVHLDGHFIVPPQKKTSTFVRVLKVALAVVSLVPGFFLGAFFKGLAMLSGSIRTSYREFKRLYNTKTEDQCFITDSVGTYLLLGDRSTLKPSLESYKNGYPWTYLDKAIKGASTLHLQNMTLAHIERVLKLNALQEKCTTKVDLRGVAPTIELIDLLIEKCPNLQTLDCSDFYRVSHEAFDRLLAGCPQLDETTKTKLEMAQVYS